MKKKQTYHRIFHFLFCGFQFNVMVVFMASGVAGVLYTYNIIPTSRAPNRVASRTPITELLASSTARKLYDESADQYPPTSLSNCTRSN